MKKLLADVRSQTRGRPFLTFLAIIYSLLPILFVVVAILSLVQREQIGAEARRNCQRSAAIAKFIRDSVGKHPNLKLPPVQRIVELQHTLERIGPCKIKH